MVKKLRRWAAKHNTRPFHESQGQGHNLTAQDWAIIQSKEPTQLTNLEISDYAQGAFHEQMMLFGHRFHLQALKFAYDHPGKVFPEQDSNTYDRIISTLTVAIVGQFCMAAETVGAFCCALEATNAQKTPHDKVHALNQYLRNYSPHTNVATELYELMQKPLSDAAVQHKVRAILNCSDPGNLDKIKKQSCKHLHEQLGRIGQEHLELTAFYNAYKHGYRLAEWAGPGMLQGHPGFFYPEKNQTSTWHFHAFKEPDIEYYYEGGRYCAMVHEGFSKGLDEMIVLGPKAGSIIIQDQNPWKVRS